jgi:hypothetical protein
MRSPEVTITRLEGVLCDATVIVRVNGRPAGTAFFIDDERLLTCSHVLPRYGKIEIEPGNSGPIPADVVARDEEKDRELAILAVPAGSVRGESCVVLGRGPHEGGCLMVAFQDEPGMGPGPGLEPVNIRTRPHWGYQNRVTMLRIEEDRRITPGMSGAPVMSKENGTVVGVVRTTENPSRALGGGAIPISWAAAASDGEVAPVLRGLLDSSKQAMIKWRNALGYDNWQSLGRPWDLGEACVDLRVSGKRKCWQISLDQVTAPGHSRTGPDLGEDIAEALFDWAQRRRIRERDEVRLLGPLLAAALFPASAVAHLSKISSVNDVLVRLHVDSGIELADIPWELAAVPEVEDRSGARGQLGGRTSFLATDSRFRFVRAMKSAADSLPFSPAAKPADVKVFAVVAQPSAWHRRYPALYPRRGGDSYSWPEQEVMARELGIAVKGNGFSLELCAQGLWSEMSEALQTGEYSVLHFMGVGRSDASGPEIALVQGGSHGKENWTAVREVVDLAAEHGVRLIVFELLLPPERLGIKPLTHSAVGDVIRGSVKALVLTHLPVHPDQCAGFNRSFYQTLANGETIGRAVQKGREVLDLDMPVDDAAGFGWFTVSTGDQSDARLVSQRPEGPLGTGVRRPFTTSSAPHDTR